MNPLPQSTQDWTIAGAAVAIATMLWRLLESARAREIARLEGELSHERAERKRERTEATAREERKDEQLVDLQDRLHRSDKRAAQVLLLARRDIGTAEDWECEAPTGVREIVDLVPSQPPKADPHGLRNWDPTEPTPPRPRAKMPSRTDR